MCDGRRGRFCVDSRSEGCYNNSVDGVLGVPDESGSEESSPYIDPGTDFLRNEVSATTQEEIDDASAELLPERLEDLADAPMPCTGDRAHLQAIHRVLFDGVFEWAGEFRTTDIDKQGTDFVPAAEVEVALEQLFADLSAENLLRGLPREQFIGHLAQFYARLNYIHPFREGNGRTQRLFWGQVALHAGWTVDFVGMSKTTNDEASRDASQDLGLEPLIAFLDEITSPAPSVEQGEADLLTSVRQEQEGQSFIDWVGSHVNPDRAQ